MNCDLIGGMYAKHTCWRAGCRQRRVCGAVLHRTSSSGWAAVTCDSQWCRTTDYKADTHSHTPSSCVSMSPPCEEMDQVPPEFNLHPFLPHQHFNQALINVSVYVCMHGKKRLPWSLHVSMCVCESKGNVCVTRCKKSLLPRYLSLNSRASCWLTKLWRGSLFNLCLQGGDNASACMYVHTTRRRAGPCMRNSGGGIKAATR